MRRSTRDRYLRGRALFDAGSYFAAHEVWEEAWLIESGDTRVFLQGLIQIAAALHKASRQEHPGGCVRLFDAGLAKLDLTAHVFPSPAEEFLAATRSVRERAAAWARGEAGAPPPISFPKLRSRTRPPRRVPPAAGRKPPARRASIPRKRRGGS
jgi:hypothetical protein